MYVMIKVDWVVVEQDMPYKESRMVTDVKFTEDYISLIRYGEEVCRIPTVNLCELHIKPML